MTKQISLIGKACIAIFGAICSILHWIGKLDGASISEIWECAGFMYAVCLGTVDFNICRKSWVEANTDADDKE